MAKSPDKCGGTVILPTMARGLFYFLEFGISVSHLLHPGDGKGG